MWIPHRKEKKMDNETQCLSNASRFASEIFSCLKSNSTDFFTKVAILTKDLFNMNITQFYCDWYLFISVTSKTFMGCRRSLTIDYKLIKSSLFQLSLPCSALSRLSWILHWPWDVLKSFLQFGPSIIRNLNSMVFGNGGCEKSYPINIALSSFRLFSKARSLMSW